MTYQIKFRRDTAANFTSTNPVLAAGEPGFETDFKRLKIGDGVNTWANLTYANIAIDSNITVGYGLTKVLNNIDVNNVQIQEQANIAIANSLTSLTANVNSVNTLTGNVVLTTTEIAEGSNLYYSNARVNAFIQSDITTTDIDEGTNLYYSNARVNAFIQSDITTTDIDEGTNLYFSNARVNAFVQDSITTTDIDEGTNLYYSNTRVTAHIATVPLTVGGNLTVNGNLEVFGNIDYVNVQDLQVVDNKIILNFGNATAREAFIIVDRSGSALSNAQVKWNEADDRWEINDGANTYIVPRSTTDLAEGTNLYYSNARVNAFIQSSITTTDIDEGANLYYSNARVNAFIQNSITTTDIDEGTNLYYSNARVNAFVQDSITTTDIDEGANLYFTTDRANTAIGAYQGNINTAGTITATSFTGDGSDLTDVRSDTVEEKVINKSGGTLPKGTPVFATGGVTSDALWVDACDAGNAATMPCIGVLATALNDDAEGRAIIVGKISGVDTSAFAAGDEIYVAVGGGYTKVPPASESNVIQFLGTVTRVDSTQGGGIVKLAPPRAESNLNNGNVFIGNANNSTVTAALSTSIVPEGSNLYFTTDRANTAMDNYLTSITANVTSVNGQTGVVVLDTGDIAESGNLYFTTDRANTAIGAYDGDINTTGNVTAAYLLGNGSQLTGFVSKTANVDSVNGLTGAVSLSDANVGLKVFSETEVALGNVSGDISSNIDLSLGSVFTMTATGDITINSLANVSNGVSATLIITQDATGSRLLTSNLLYAGNIRTLSTAANAIDIISVVSSGNVFYAAITKGYV